MKKTLLALIIGAGVMLAQDPPHEQCNTCWMDAECYWCHLSTFDGGRVCLDCSGVMGMTHNKIPSQLNADMLKVAKRQYGRRGLTEHGLEIALLNSVYELLSPRKKNVQGHSTDAYLTYVKSNKPCFSLNIARAR